MKSWLIIEEGHQSGGIFRLKQDILTVGRGPANPIQIVDRSVSRQHAQLKRIKNSYWITDLASRNGVYVNSRQISKQTPLRNGDILQIGDVMLLYLEGEAPSDQPDLVLSWKKSSETTRIAGTVAMQLKDLDPDDTHSSHP